MTSMELLKKLCDLPSETILKAETLETRYGWTKAHALVRLKRLHRWGYLRHIGPRTKARYQINDWGRTCATRREKT